MTNILLLPTVSGIVNASQQGDFYCPIAFQSNSAAIDLTGIAFTLLLRPMLATTGAADPLTILLTGSTSGQYLTSSGTTGVLSIYIPQSAFQNFAPGTYFADLLASGDGYDLVLGELQINQSAVGPCIVESFTSAARNSATAASVGYIPGPGWNQYRGNWSSTASYALNDVVSYGVSTWIATAANTNEAPAQGSSYWSVVALGLDPTALNNAVSEASASATSAGSSASAAAGSAASANASAVNAQTSATNAGNSASSASESAGSASSSATAAANSATAAAGSASAASTSATNAANSATAAATSAAQAAASIVLRGYLAGLTLSNDATTPNTVLDISAGMATSDDNQNLMVLAAAITKSIASNWAVGSGNGGLDTGTAAVSTGYHVFLIERTDTGVVDVLFSLSATAPTMPANYTKKRRIGAIRTNGSSQIIAFKQRADEFLWAASVVDVSSIAVSASTPTLVGLSVPTGVQVMARFRAFAAMNGGNTSVTFYSPDETSPTGSGLAAVSNDWAAGAFDVRTDLNGRIGFESDTAIASGNFSVTTYGWFDTRGRLD